MTPRTLLCCAALRRGVMPVTSLCHATCAGAYTHAEFLNEIPLTPYVGNLTLKASHFSETSTANVTGVGVA
jgi:hypothetical protein